MSTVNFLATLKHFSTETEENIIDHLWDDVQALRSCSLTCRAWLPRSRFHLLYAIRIYDRKQLDALYDTFERYPQRRLLVHSVTTAPKRLKGDPGPVIEVFPLALLSQSPNLRCWKIDQTTTKVVKQREMLSFHPTTFTRLRCSSIDELHLTSLRFKSDTELLRLVLALPLLRKLLCDDLHFAAIGPNLDQYQNIVHRRMTNVSCLEVSHDSATIPE